MGERRVIGHCSRAGKRVEPREVASTMKEACAHTEDGSAMSCDGECVCVVSM
jgi:hypothetical protein